MKILKSILLFIWGRLFMWISLLILAIVTIRSPEKALDIIRDWAERERKYEQAKNVVGFVQDLKDFYKPKKGM